MPVVMTPIKQAKRNFRLVSILVSGFIAFSVFHKHGPVFQSGPCFVDDMCNSGN